MQTTDLRIAAADGYPLAATLFEPASKSGRVVILNSAMGVRRDFYAPFARRLAADGFTVITYDYRGIGGSRPARLKGFPARTQDLGERDVAGVIDWAAHYPGARILVAGHSIGGQLFGLAHNSFKVAGLLAIAAQSGYWKHWPVPGRAAMWALWHALLPLAARTTGYVPARRLGLGEDIPGGVARQWTARGRSPHYTAGPPGSPTRERFGRWRGALLAYSFADDHYAPRAAVDALLAFYRGARVEHRHVSPFDLGAGRIGHFGFLREKLAATLWRECSAWLAAA